MTNFLVPNRTPYVLPDSVASSGGRASAHFLEFFTAPIRNPHTRRAYARAVGELPSWCEGKGAASLAAIQPMHFAAWVELRELLVSAPTVKRQLAALRQLFERMMIGQGLPTNPALSVRGPRRVVCTARQQFLTLWRAAICSTSTGITAYLNNRRLEMVASMANHVSTLTMQRNDRRREELSLDGVDRIVIRRCERATHQNCTDKRSAPAMISNVGLSVQHSTKR